MIDTTLPFFHLFLSGIEIIEMLLFLCAYTFCGVWVLFVCFKFSLHLLNTDYDISSLIMGSNSWYTQDIYV